MTLKQEIVAELGEADLLLPGRIARSLAANDQIKYYFALLQTRARTPIVPASRRSTSRASASPARLQTISWTMSSRARARIAAVLTGFLMPRKSSGA